MSDRYFLPIPRDVSISKQKNFCDFFEKFDIYSAPSIVAGGIEIEKKQWPDLFTIEHELKTESTPEVISKIASKAFHIGIQPVMNREDATNLKSYLNQLDHFAPNQDIGEYSYALRNAIALSKSDGLEDCLQKIRSSFFRHFPEGSILFIKKSPLFVYASRLPMMLAGLAFMQSDDIEDLINDGHGAFHAFDKGHSLLSRDFMNLGLVDIDGKIFGFSASSLSHQFVFLLGKKIDTDPKFSSTKQALVRGVGAFTDMWSDDTQAKPPSYKWRANDYAEMFFRHLKSINQSLTFMLDSTNFLLKDTRTIAIKTHKYNLMTFDALQEILLRIHSAHDNLSRKLLFFDFIDRYVGLFNLTTKEVFNPDYFSQKVVPAVGMGLKARLATDLEKQAKYDQHGVFLSVLNGIYQTNRRKKRRVYIGRDRSEALTYEDYYASFMKALRDTTHGYPLDKQKFEKFLSIHTGSISNVLPRLATYFNLYLLNCPKEALRACFGSIPQE